MGDKVSQRSVGTKSHQPIKGWKEKHEEFGAGPAWSRQVGGITPESDELGSLSAASRLADELRCRRAGGADASSALRCDHSLLLLLHPSIQPFRRRPYISRWVVCSAVAEALKRDL